MTKRQRAIKDLLIPDPTPNKQLIHPSGWCMTNEHSGCKYQFDHGKCGCSCHSAPKSVSKSAKAVADDSKTQKAQKPRKAVANIAPTKIIVDEIAPDPRPWKR